MEQTKISIGLGVTVNLGDFESVRLDIRVDDFVRPVDESSTSKAIDRVYALVEAKLQEKITVASGKRIVDA